MIVFKWLTTLLIISCICRTGFSQNYTGSGGAIPDNGNSIDFPLNVSFLSPPTIDTSTFGLESVCLDITHTYDSDLDISLVAPDGTIIILTAGNGGGGHDYNNTCFSSTASTSIVAGSAPFSGTYKPQGQLGMVNNGQTGNGTWILHILDTYPFADAGNLISWSITFGNNPAIPYVFGSSNLPLIKINTNGQSVVNEPKITADMGIINNGIGIRNFSTDPFNDFDGKIGIEFRGASSLGFPQKSYLLETRDSAGNAMNVSLLGMPPDNDWILYAPYTDKSLIRNALTYKIANEMGGYACKTVFCELIINDTYAGIYVLMEKIKRGSNRVDIASMSPADSAGDALTGGYIAQIDRDDEPHWVSNYLPLQTNPWLNKINIQYVYPKDNEITLKQQNYIKAYVDSFEDALASPYFADPLIGFRKYADDASFIDFFLINEISKNVDGYRLSTYFHKERNSLGGKIHMGPVWDFNLAFRNADYCNNASTAGWAYDIQTYCDADIPFWFGKMMLDSNYNNAMRCRYNKLRTTVFDTTYLFAYIDSMALYLNEAQQRHYVTWPILGVYVWPNPAPLAATYQAEIENTKIWIRQRFLWLDAHVPGHCYATSASEITSINTLVKIFPNPSNGQFSVYFQGLNDIATIEIHDFTGRLVFMKAAELKQGNSEIKLDLSGLQKGIYFLTIRQNQGEAIFQKVVIE